MADSAIFERVKNLCKDNGIGVSTLIMEITGSGGNITTWKKGNIRTDYLSAVCKKFGVTADYLLTGQDDSTLLKNSLKGLYGLFEATIELGDPALSKKLNITTEEIRAWLREEYSPPPTAALLSDMIALCKKEGLLAEDSLHVYKNAVVYYDAHTKRNRLLSDVKATGDLCNALIKAGVMDASGNLIEKGVSVLTRFINTNAELLKQLVDNEV